MPRIAAYLALSLLCGCAGTLPPADPSAVVAKTTEFRVELGKVDLVSPDTRLVPIPVYLLVRRDGSTFEVSPAVWSATQIHPE